MLTHEDLMALAERYGHMNPLQMMLALAAAEDENLRLRAALADAGATVPLAGTSRGEIRKELGLGADASDA